MANEFVIKNGYFSQGNSNVTGSLQVTGSVGVTGSVSITQNVTASKALFSSSNGDQLTVMGSGSTVAQVYGSQGNLLTVNDTFSGSIFTVTDISGYPILDVTSDYYTSSINTVGFLNHTGRARVTGSLIVSGGFIVYNTSPNYKVIDSALSNLYYSDGDVSIDWANSFLKDTDTAVSINWDTRLLIANDNSTTHIDWDNPSYMKFPSVNASVPIVSVLGLDINNNLYATASTAFGGGGSGTPGGSNKQIQFNKLGAFSGSSNFTFDNSSNTVEISGSLTVSGSGTFTNIGPAQFTGSVGVSGSLTITDSLNITQGGLTGSLFGTASYVSGSVFTNANPALSASYALTASYIANSLITASSVSNVITFTKGDGSTFPISVGSTNTQIAAKYMGFGNNITGSTAISASYNLLIPANTFTVGDTVRVNCLYDRNAQGNSSFIWYITGSTTPFSFSVVGGTQIAVVNTTTIRGLAMSRLLYISSSTNTEVVAANVGNLSSDEHGPTPGNSAWGAATSSLNINWTQDQWIVFAHQNALTSNLTRVYRFMATKV